ncbi:MAG: hypothetical protein IJ532_08320 [Alphaproteobacteria bacterium]|nr:hypothetical protein [Alphaproteobacteria bacterium]
MVRKSNLYKFICILCSSIGCLTAYAEYPEDCVFLISGVCFDCNTPYTLEIGTKENCVKHCPQREYVERRYFNTCEIKNIKYPDFYPFNTLSSQVPLENCEKKEGYFYNISEDECYPCDTIKPVWVKTNCEESDECLHRCPNRMIQYTGVTTADSVLKCPSERPLMDRFLACWSCDEPTPIEMSFNQEKILGAKYNRQSTVCYGQRYFDERTGTLSYPCPQDKSNLFQKACEQCGGKWLNNKCS